MPERGALWMCGAALASAVWGVSAGEAQERDPFTFGPRDEAVAQASPTLIGILWDTTHPLAIVGDQTVGIGDAVAGWQVTQIQPDGITIERGARRELLTPGQPLPPTE